MPNVDGSDLFERKDFDKVTVVRLKTPKILNEKDVQELFDPIYALVGNGRNRLVLDLDVVEFFPSIGLGKLLKLNQKVRADGGRLAFCHITPAVKELFETTRLHAFFHIYATVEDALQSFL